MRKTHRPIADADNEIIRSVYSYYIEHKDVGKKYYDFSESKDFDSIYQQIDVSDAEKLFPRACLKNKSCTKWERAVL